MSLTIVDSDILIDVSRGDEIAAKWLDNTALESVLAISIITEMELMIGSQNKDHFKEIRHFSPDFRSLILTSKFQNAPLPSFRGIT